MVRHIKQYLVYTPTGKGRVGKYIGSVRAMTIANARIDAKNKYGSHAKVKSRTKRK